MPKQKPRWDSICLEGVYLERNLARDLLCRLNRLEGHIRGIRKMLEEHKSCDDILIQVAAVKAAVNQVAVRLVEGHMETCVADSVEAGEGEQALARLKGALATLLRQF